jgi:hypothetical protein
MRPHTNPIASQSHRRSRMKLNWKGENLSLMQVESQSKCNNLKFKISSIKYMAKRSNKSTVGKLLGHIDSSGAEILASVLPEGVISGASVITSVEMIVKQKVDGFDVGHLEAVDGLAVVLLGSEEFPDLLDGQQAAEPVPFVVVADEEADVAVGALVA